MDADSRLVGIKDEGGGWVKDRRNCAYGLLGVVHNRIGQGRIRTGQQRDQDLEPFACYLKCRIVMCLKP